MKILDYGVNMSAQHQKMERYQKEERLEMWVGKRPANPEGRVNLPDFITDMLEISEEGKDKLKNNTVQQVSLAESPEDLEIASEETRKILILEAMIEQLTGKRFRFIIPKHFNSKNASQPLKGNVPENIDTPSEGWGIEYDLRESYYQKETMSFTADGVVKTSDGREINFSVQLNMTKEFAYQQHISFRAGDAVKIDPLVIHFDGINPSLTEQKYEFDLDVDGILDTISFVGLGSGFLALDKNEDGMINDGAELFGPQTGNGFAELAEYDEDGNGWIDENDSIFNKLVIWTKDKAGNDRLFSLGEKGIGAIYLGHVASPFGLSDNQHQLQGEIAQTGVFLKEDGKAGLIQHIDLVV